MGHIRLGQLPKTRKWAGVFSLLSGATISAADFSEEIALAARDEFAALKGNQGISYCFWILARIVTAARSDNFVAELTRLGIKTSHIDSGLGFVKQVGEAVQREVRKRSGPSVFVEIAQLTLREILVSNVASQSQSLFGTTIADVQRACRAVSTQRLFGAIAREFFAKFMARSIQHLSDKEISNHIGPAGPLSSSDAVLKFYAALERYCVETSRIVEDYSGGWLSKQNWETNNDITEDAALGFTAYALEKLQMELQRDRR